ncbi:MAG: chromosomal replication initiator protein DnaA [Desulfotignum sp.]|nr:chromosomal replication initiator protein DnaA [Desulfotignum sp.]MCF8126334.1 chromosomal replication initiator protein DnaA [Desulfotignum sp.]
MDGFWAQVKSQIKKSIPDHSYRMWIDPVELLEFEDDRVCLSTPNEFFVRRLKENYLALFEKEFNKLGRQVRIEFKAESPRNKKRPGDFAADFLKPKAKVQACLPGFDARFNSGRMLKKGYTFDDFVVGDNSSFAYSASLSLAQGKMNGAGILYLLGKTGLGKSHLSQAVGHHVITNQTSLRVYYVTAEDFTNEMIFALRNNTIDTFKEKYRKKCEVLILEDIHFLSGKKAIQKELAITLDYLLNANRKIIFSGCDLPDDIPKLDDQLKSRLTMGLVTEIQAPDFKTRVKILRKKSKNLNCIIPTPVTEYIAQELCDDVRQLESGLFGVAAKGQLLGRHIDIELAKSVLANIRRHQKRITIEGIKKLVCKEYAVTEQDLVSASRKKRIVKPRQVAIFLSRKYTDQPIKKIGSSFKRYHATAIYSVNAVEKELKQKGVLFEQIQYLCQKIESGKY